MLAHALCARLADGHRAEDELQVVRVGRVGRRLDCRVVREQHRLQRLVNRVPLGEPAAARRLLRLECELDHLRGPAHAYNTH